MRLYLSAGECATVASALSFAYANTDEDTRKEIETLLERIDVCVHLQGKPKPKTKGKKSKT